MLTILILVAFFVGVLIPSKVAVDSVAPPTSAEIEKYIIQQCSTTNVVEIQQHTFYCFTAQVPKK